MATERAVVWMIFIRRMYAACSLWATKWASVLLSRGLRYEPATMNGREGMDLQLCRLWGGHALLMVPHRQTPGMHVCEVSCDDEDGGVYVLMPRQVEAALDSHPRRRLSRSCLFAPRQAIWVNAGALAYAREPSETGRTCVRVAAAGLMPAQSRGLTAAMHWAIRARMCGGMREIRHYREIHFMMLLNHLWNVQERPPGFVERWALRGPGGLDEMWEEVVAQEPPRRLLLASRVMFLACKERYSSA